MTDEELKKIKPKRHLPKNRAAVKARKQKVFQGVVLEGRSCQEVGIEAGFSPHTAAEQASHIITNPENKKAFLDILEEVGLSDQALADKAFALFHAKKKVFAQKDGVFTDEREVDDNECQRKTWADLAEIAGHKKANQVNINTNVNVMAAMAEFKASQKGE